MGNLLEFALALQTSEFLSKLGLAEGGVLSLASVFDVVRRAAEQTWDAIEKGAELRGLSSATGESVKSLYEFEHGLEAIGGQAQSVSSFFLLTQRALSGVNEAGQRTSTMFAALGLDISKLRGEDTVKAITEIAGALNKLNPAQASGVAESLFGRFNAESILQISRNMDLFKGGMSSASNTAALLDKFAKTFEQVKADAGDIQSDFLGIWTAVGGAIGPELHKIFSEVHEDIKNFGPAITGAVEGGHVKELLASALEAGGEQGLNYLEAGLAATAMGFGEALLLSVSIAIRDILPMLFHLGEVADASVVAAGTEVLGKITGNKKMEATGKGSLEALTMVGAKEFGSDLANAFKDMTSGAGIGGDMKSLWDQMLKTAPHTELDQFQALVKSLASAGVAGSASGSKPGPADEQLPMPNVFKPEWTSLEKMGFVSKGFNAELPDIANILRQIEYNTKPRAGDPNNSWNKGLPPEFDGYHINPPIQSGL